MFYGIVIGYTIFVIAFIAIALIDWTFGIDKFNPMIDKLLSKVKIDPEVMFPTISCTALGILSLFMYFCSGWIFFHVIYFFSVGAGLIILGLIVAVWLIIKILSSIRSFIISKKD